MIGLNGIGNGITSNDSNHFSMYLYRFDENYQWRTCHAHTAYVQYHSASKSNILWADDAHVSVMLPVCKTTEITNPTLPEQTTYI